MDAERYFISTDRALLDLDVIHGFLATCYWSPGIARERVERGIAHSLCWGVYDRAMVRATREPRVGVAAPGETATPMGTAAQVGFARVVTDCASFAYLCDVFVIESHRGRGLSKKLMEAIVRDESLRGIRRLCLMTRDAHELYRRFGFAPMPDASRYMEIVDREGYRTP